MLGILHLLLYMACGVMIIRWLLPKHSVLTRLWLGMSLGLLLNMWLPAITAFFLRFSLVGHGAAIALLGLVTLCSWLLRDKHPAKEWDDRETVLLKQMLLVVLPLTVLSAYLQYTHVMRIDQWGNWNVGQSTYGDLPMHLSFITSLKNAAFPPEYSFFPGHRLSYPFLTDSLSTTYYLLGWSLQTATTLPATVMMVLCYMGFLCLAREMTAGKKTVILAMLLFFLNGGLGFLYDFDLAGGYTTMNNGTKTLTVWTRIKAILDGYYKTPTNQPDPNNLRWSNVIADMMIPQRTLLGGWCMVFPCFYLLHACYAPEMRGSASMRGVLLLGVWAGLLPLVHTHSFLALGLYTAGTMVWDLIHEPDKKQQITHYLVYGGVAVALALPQLFCFTFPQAFQEAGTEGSGHTFLQLWFNWVNNPNQTGLRDMYLWFYIKNIGLPFVILLFALFEKNRRWRRMFAGCFLIILAVETVRFQPNTYDNNKLLYLAWMPCCMIVADWCALLWHRMKGMRGRSVMAAVTAVVFFLSAGLTLWRECVSTYQAFSADAVETGEYIRDHTEEHCTILTGTQHLNPVIAVAGRNIVCGPDLWLYFHGFDTNERHEDLTAFYQDPEYHMDVLDKYDVDYIYVSGWERSSYMVNEEALNALFPVVYDENGYTLWEVPKG